MLRKFILWSIGIFIFAVIGIAYCAQVEPLNTIPLPTDIKIWGGLSLALIFNRGLVPLLVFLKVLTDKNKKLVGVVLLVVGGAIGLIFSLLTAKLTDPLEIFLNVASGALAGILAVGAHSTIKNTLQYFRSPEQARE